MTAYYFAAPYPTHPAMREHRDELLRVEPDAEVTSRWIDFHGSPMPVECPPEQLRDDPATCWTYAEADLLDILRADVIVSFTGLGGRGGRHVEYGYAIAKGTRLVIVGPREHVFHCHPRAEVYPTWTDFLKR